jgi:regulator of protease activity HflC (stomatin/prohibitin superfamily)
MRTCPVQIKPVDAFTLDNAKLTVDVLLLISVSSSKDFTYKVNGFEKTAGEYAGTLMRNAIGNMKLDECLSGRDEIKQAIEQTLATQLIKWGVSLDQIEVKEVTPSGDIIANMERQVVAMREARQIEITAEAEKKASIAKAEGMKSAAILKSEGELSAAENEAKAIVARATGEADAIKLNADATATVNLKLLASCDENREPIGLNYLVAMEYAKGLVEISKSDSSKLVVVPAETDNMVGAIAQFTQTFNATKIG